MNIELLKNETKDPILNQIVDKVLKEERINSQEGIHLFENADLNFVGALANYIRERKHGDKTYFNKNFHVEPTNICVFDCKFCGHKSQQVCPKPSGWLPKWSPEDL